VPWYAGDISCLEVHFAVVKGQDPAVRMANAHLKAIVEVKAAAPDVRNPPVFSRD
jgi:hypothetical protein